LHRFEAAHMFPNLVIPACPSEVRQNQPLPLWRAGDSLWSQSRTRHDHMTGILSSAPTARIVPFLFLAMLLAVGCTEASADPPEEPALAAADQPVAERAPLPSDFTGTLELWYSHSPEFVRAAKEALEAEQIYNVQNYHPEWTCGIAGHFTDHLGREWRIRQACDIEEGSQGSRPNRVPFAEDMGSLVVEPVDDTSFIPVPLINSTRISGPWSNRRKTMQWPLEESGYVAVRVLLTTEGQVVADWDTGRQNHNWHREQQFSLEPDGNGVVEMTARERVDFVRGGGGRGTRFSGVVNPATWSHLVTQCTRIVDNDEKRAALREVDLDAVTDVEEYDAVQEAQHRRWNSQDIQDALKMCDDVLNEKAHPHVAVNVRWHGRVLGPNDAFASARGGPGTFVN